MKKLYPYFTILLCGLLFSCSSEDQQNITFLDANVDGATYLFNTFHITKETRDSGNETQNLVTVTASIERGTNRLIAFTAEKDKLGYDACWYIAYIENGEEYVRFDNSFSFEVVESTKDRIRGIFSGPLKSPETGKIVYVKGGTFDIFHH